MTDFWSEALHLRPSSRDPDDDFRVPRGERVNNDDPEDTYVVLRDPEGNEFCICLVR